MSVTTFLDGFDYYSTNGITRKWSAVSGAATIYSTGGRRDGGYLKLTPGASARVLKTIVNSTHITTGFAFKVSQAELTAGISNILLTLFDVDTPQIILRVAADTHLLQLCRQGYNGVWNDPVLLATSAAPITLDSWVHLEVGVNVSNTGSIELRMNGSVDAGIISANFDTSFTGGACNGVALGAANTSYIAYNGVGSFDDVKISYGDALLWHGDRRVDYLPLSADSTPQDWAVSAGNAFEALNGNGENVQSSTLGAISRFALANPTFTPNTISTVQIIADTQKSDSGSRAISLLAKVGANEAASSDIYLGQALATVTAEVPTVPVTGAAWTLNDLNDLIIGAEVSV